MLNTSTNSRPLSISGFVFDRSGVRLWHSRKPKLEWSEVQSFHIDISRWRKPRYLLRFITSGFKSLEIRVRPGVSTYLDLIDIVQLIDLMLPHLRLGLDFEAEINRAREFSDPQNMNTDSDGELVSRRVLFNLDALSFKNALKDCSSLQRIEGFESTSRRLRIKTLIALGKISTAKRELSKYTKLHPDEKDLQVEFALAALHRGKRSGETQARQLVDDSLESVADVGVQLSDYLANKGKYEEALDVLSTMEQNMSRSDISDGQTLSSMRDRIKNAQEFRGIRLKSLILRPSLGSLFACLTILALSYWVAKPSLSELPIIFEKSSNIYNLQKGGSRTQEVIIQGVQSIQSFDLQRVLYRYRGSRSQSWRVGESLMTRSEANALTVNPDFLYVTFDQLNSRKSEIGPLSASRSWAVLLASVDRLHSFFAGLAMILAFPIIWIGARIKAVRF